MSPMCEADPCRAKAVRKLIWRDDHSVSLPVCQRHANAAKRLYQDTVLVMYL